jgi:hypothetical protein
MEEDKYHGYKILHEPDTQVTAAYRDHWFNVSDGDTAPWVFRLCMRVHWEYALTQGDSSVHPLDESRRLARDLGLRWIRGLIDTDSFEGADPIFEVRDEHWDPTFGDAASTDEDLRFQLLSSLRRMNRAQLASSEIYELDVGGIADVLGVARSRVKGVLSEMLLEGVARPKAEIYGSTAEDGACEITGEGLRELRALEQTRQQIRPRTTLGTTYDVFVCHASEDKDVARPLATALEERGIRVWFDEFELRIGDSLRRKIDAGLAKSRFGVVIFSQAFFSKNWTQYELDGLVAREMSHGEQAILPLWHNISKDEMLQRIPSIADKIARRTSDSTVAEIADEIRDVVLPQEGSPSP